MDAFGRNGNMASRVLNIPFQYNNSQRVKAKLTCELTEAGKQLVANAAQGEKFAFAIYAYLGQCNKAGKIIISSNGSERAYPGVYVSELGNFLNVLTNENTSMFYQTL